MLTLQSRISEIFRKREKKMNRSVFLLLISFVLTAAVPGAADAKSRKEATAEMLSSSATSWVNTEGSTMSLVFAEQGSAGVYALSGSYINSAPGFACQGTPYPITGWYYANTQVLSFDVVWTNASEDCQSVTGWTGYIGFPSSGPTMTTNWNLAYATSSTGRAIEQGADTFTMTSVSVRKSLIAE